MSQKFGSLLAAGVTREFLANLPWLSSRAAMLLLLPMALHTEYTTKYNDLTYYIEKKELVDYMGLPKSYKDEGHMNKLLSQILLEELFPLEVCGIKILDMEETSLPRNWFCITYTQEAMDRFFQGLSKGYFVIALDTLKKMKHRHTWTYVKELILNYDFTNFKTQPWFRHTKYIKEMLGYGIADYTTGESGKFDRSNFEKKNINPCITDLLTMKQFKLFEVKGSTPEKPLYLGKDYTYRGKRVVDNYFIAYKILKVEEKKEFDINQYLYENIKEET